MALRKVFKTGGAVVVALPKQFREALRLVPGTLVVVTLKDRAITMTRAVVTPENMIGSTEAASAARDPREE